MEGLVVCDLTHAHTPTSGGIRTYIETKRSFLLQHTDHRHVMIIPGEEHSIERGDRWATYRLPGITIPWARPYRFFSRKSAIVEALRDAMPDIVELNTYYLPPESKAAFEYRDWATKNNTRCVVGIHYHTDFANAYAKHYSRPMFGERISDRIEQLAAGYVRSILARSDFNLTFSARHLESIKKLGIRDVDLVPQFVDLDHFNPSRRSQTVRDSYGIRPDTFLMVYAGRFDSEKHVEVLIDALELMPTDLDCHLVMLGAGPLHDAISMRASALVNLTVGSYLSNKDALADLLASADTYVTAGPHEVAAFSVVEAQASGLPCVGVDAGGLRGRIVEGTGYLGPVGDANAMARNMTRAFENREVLAANARRHAALNYGLALSFSEILRHYEESLHEHGAAT